jgi:hypothetical protein
LSDRLKFLKFDLWAQEKENLKFFLGKQFYLHQCGLLPRILYNYDKVYIKTDAGMINTPPWLSQSSITTFTKGTMRHSRPPRPARTHPFMAELARNLAINKDLNNSEINAAVGQYPQLANQWANLAGNALRFINPIFDHVKMMLNSQYQADRQNSFATDETNSQRLERFSSRDNLLTVVEISAARQLGDLTRR